MLHLMDLKSNNLEEYSHLLIVSEPKFLQQVVQDVKYLKTEKF